MTNGRYDCFVSYSHNDKEWVVGTLLRELEQRGFRVCIDFRDFVGGSLSVDEMQRAVESSRRTVIVLSKSYVKSEWARFENAMAQTMDPAAAERKLVPVLREYCEIPLRLRILHYRNLTAWDVDEFERLVGDLL